MGAPRDQPSIESSNKQRAKIQQCASSFNLFDNRPGGNVVKGPKGEGGHSASQADYVVGHREVRGGQAEQQRLGEQDHHRVHCRIAPEQVLKRRVLPEEFYVTKISVVDKI